MWCFLLINHIFFINTLLLHQTIRFHQLLYIFSFKKHCCLTADELVCNNAFIWSVICLFLWCAVRHNSWLWEILWLSGPTCKCAQMKQVPSVFPCTSPTLCHCDLRILTLHDDITASDWIHWACAVTMHVIIKAKSKETRFCRAAYSVLLLVHSECWWSYSAKWHCSKKANTWFFKGGSNGCKTLLLALKNYFSTNVLGNRRIIYIY